MIVCEKGLNSRSYLHFISYSHVEVKVPCVQLITNYAMKAYGGVDV
jgi:hypothetical protein